MKRAIILLFLFLAGCIKIDAPEKKYQQPKTILEYLSGQSDKEFHIARTVTFDDGDIRRLAVDVEVWKRDFRVKITNYIVGKDRESKIIDLEFPFRDLETMISDFKGLENSGKEFGMRSCIVSPGYHVVFENGEEFWILEEMI